MDCQSGILFVFFLKICVFVSFCFIILLVIFSQFFDSCSLTDFLLKEGKLKRPEKGDLNVFWYRLP